MYNLDSLFLFLNIFSIMFILRIIYRFISVLLSNPPMRLILGNKELIFFGITLAYTITYFIKL
jgi:hypothetical protein